MFSLAFRVYTIHVPVCGFSLRHCKHGVTLFLSETLISPEVFAEVLCDDLDLPAASFVPAVVQAIRQQIKQFDTDSEIAIDQQTDQRVIIKVLYSS